MKVPVHIMTLHMYNRHQPVYNKDMTSNLDSYRVLEDMLVEQICERVQTKFPGFTCTFTFGPAGTCPVQAEGLLGNYTFYFRYRDDSATLTLARSMKTMFKDPQFTCTINNVSGDEFGGCITDIQDWPGLFVDLINGLESVRSGNRPTYSLVNNSYCFSYLYARARLDGRDQDAKELLKRIPFRSTARWLADLSDEEIGDIIHVS